MRSVLIAAALGLAGVPASAATIHYVQAVTAQGLNVTNNISVNGRTRIDAVTPVDGGSATGRADAQAGELKARASSISTGTQNGNSHFAQVRIGETITVQDGKDTRGGFDLVVDGFISSDAPSVIGSSIQASVDAYIAIFDIDSGADETNWACFLGFPCSGSIPTPIDSDRVQMGFNGHSGNVFDELASELSVRTDIVDPGEQFLVFGNLLTVAGRGNQPGETFSEFFSTASFVPVFEQGVTFTSGSGSFLTAPVPLPASGWFLLAGLGGLVATRKARSS